jgi:hypothetical protein
MARNLVDAALAQNAQLPVREAARLHVRLPLGRLQRTQAAMKDHEGVGNGEAALVRGVYPVHRIRRHSANVLSEGDTFTKDSTRSNNARWFAHRDSAAALALA